MKVMYILHSCIAGGATLSFLNLVKGIRDSGIDVVVVHPKPDKEEEHLITELTDMGCKCIFARVATSYNNSKNGIFNYIKFILRYFLIIYRKIIFYKDLNRIIKNENPDIIHTNTGVIHEGYLVAKKYNIPHVWHLREYQDKDFKMIIFPSKYYFKKMLKNSYTICITKDIQKYFNLDDLNKSFVIYNPVMSSSETKKQLYSSNFFIVANRLSPEKGMEDIFKAFSIFSKKYKNYKLLILGFGNSSYINKLKEYCNNLNISSSVDFLGFKDNAISYMKKAKALIVGSYYEGFGRMTAEANMLGIPVIGRNTGGTKEILELTKGGFLFETVEQMTEYMNEIASKSNSDIEDYMNKPKSISIKSFSNEQHINKVINLYKNIVSKGM